jgi:hypothetical protein
MVVALILQQLLFNGQQMFRCLIVRRLFEQRTSLELIEGLV